MTFLGWLIMVFSLSSVVSLTAFCLYQVLGLPPVEIESLDTAPLDTAPLDIDTRDTKDAD